MTETDRDRDIQRDRQKGKDRQSDRQTDRHTHTQTERDKWEGEGGTDRQRDRGGRKLVILRVYR